MPMSPGARFKLAFVALLLELARVLWFDTEPESRFARRGGQGGVSKSVCRNASRQKQKGVCAQMRGDTTFKSPHHEEYSSSDIPHVFLNFMFHAKT